MTEYVAGFLFNENAERVLLIEKKRPAWQAGRLNGIGGHIEPGEIALEAMHREFYEEAGLALNNWAHFATVAGPWGSVAFFRLFVDQQTFDSARSLTDEEVVSVRTDSLHLVNALPNLSWLVPLGMYRHDSYQPLVAWEHTQIQEPVNG